jgi:Leucine-rich repeat (LRR) protein
VELLRLTELNLSYNELEDIPLAVSKIATLEKLILTKNKLRKSLKITFEKI